MVLRFAAGRSIVAGCLVTLCSIGFSVKSLAQPPRPGGQRGGGGVTPGELGASNLDLGEPGIAWYTTWESAAAEAKRSGRAIMFVAAATQCRGVSGVF